MIVWYRKLLFVILAGLSWAAAAQSGAPASPYSHESIATRDYKAVTLRVIALEKPVLGEPVELHAREFEKLTGAKIEITHVPFDKLYQEVLLGLKQNKYDVLFFGSMWIADVVPYLSPLPTAMLDSVEYRDVLPHYKKVASWGEVPFMVPIDGDRHYLQYRRDLLDDPAIRTEYLRKTGKPLDVPRTWPELQAVARFLHGRQQADGSTISGIAEVTISDALLANQFIKRAAPYAKHPRVKGGFYFELDSMRALINTPGFVAALEGFIAAQDVYPPGGRNLSFPAVIGAFGGGLAAFSDSWDDPFIQAMEPGNPLRDKVAASLSPGSQRVWNRRTQRWDDFPEINRAPYIVYGWTSGVARTAPHQQAAFDFLGFYANTRNHQADLLVGRFGMNPFRRSDLDEQFWTRRAGWSSAVARSYVSTLEKMAASRNRILDLRIHRGQEYLYLLSVGVHRALSGRESPQAALDEVARRWDALTERIGVDKQRAAYRHVVRFEDNE